VRQLQHAATLSAVLTRRASAADLVRDFAAAEGIVHLANAGTTTWHGFASAILEGLKSRGQPVKAGAIHAITTADFPTKAVRPANSRLDLSRLHQIFGVTPVPWEEALRRELDILLQRG
jgi:dTDP-4-dehydrorhamnose reductase